MVDLFDDRQDFTRVDIGKPAGDENRVLLLGNETADEILGQKLDVFFYGLDAVVTILAQPAPQAFEDQTLPRPADFSSASWVALITLRVAGS